MKTPKMDKRARSVRELMHATSKFWAQVVRPAVYEEDDACWHWSGGVNSSGYGIFHFGPNKIYAHRFAWLAMHGQLPEGFFVCHRCDIRTCVRPSHLFLGTPADNARDRELKKRLREIGRVRRVGQTFLVPVHFKPVTPAERRERARLIRELDAYDYPQRFIAAQFGVHHRTVQRILESGTVEHHAA